MARPDTSTSTGLISRYYATYKRSHTMIIACMIRHASVYGGDQIARGYDLARVSGHVQVHNAARGNRPAGRVRDARGRIGLVLGGTHVASITFLNTSYGTLRGARGALSRGGWRMLPVAVRARVTSFGRPRK